MHQEERRLWALSLLLSPYLDREEEGEAANGPSLMQL